MLLRVAHPSRDLEVAGEFYCGLLGFERLGGFEGHDGYDGAFFGPRGADWHLECTRHVSGAPQPAPTDEDLLVLYDSSARLALLTAALEAAGHDAVEHPNPYWASVGARAYADPDGYLVVLCPAG